MTNIEPYREPPATTQRDGRGFTERDGNTRPAPLPNRFLRWIELLRQALEPIPKFTKGTGTPEAVVNGAFGDRFFRTDGAAGTFLYVKTTNGGNTGWIAYA